jgi:DeoR-like protein with HTH domain
MARRLNAAEEIISEAKKGEAISADKRRHAVGYLLATQGELTNMEIAELFNVSDRTIREDKAYVRKQAAELVSVEDIGMVIADIRLTYESFRQKLALSLKKSTPGTATHLNHLKLELDSQLRVVEALQSLGWYPRNLGELTRKNFTFVAVTSGDGSIDTRPVDSLPVVDMPMLSASSEDADAELARRNEEFGPGAV